MNKRIKNLITFKKKNIFIWLCYLNMYLLYCSQKGYELSNIRCLKSVKSGKNNITYLKNNS